MDTNIKHLIGCFTECELDNIIQERFSSKASRVFRYIATFSVLTLTLLQYQVYPSQQVC